MKKIPKTDKVQPFIVGTIFKTILYHSLSPLPPSPSLSLQTDPKRFKKTLPKILKGMKTEDRVMIVGVTTNPFG